MPNYRRIRSPGSTWFFTLVLEDRSSTLLTRHIDALRDSIRRVRTRHPFRVDAMVVLPDHLHAVWTLPEGDSSYPMRWSQIKAGFSRRIPASEARSASRSRKRERGIWQRRYWEHRIRDARDLERHVEYTHFNPVKHGLVLRASDWPWSTLHAYVRRGWCDANWAAAEHVRDMRAAE